MTKEKTTAPGKVWLVGAGPGDPELITLKAIRMLSEADVVIYDNLANDKLLGHCVPGCEFVYVGKRAGWHAATQSQIQEAMITHASAGRRVVRLKGGDPSVFARLGEETHALIEAGIPFEIVPGVTAATAAAAAARFSLTHRAHASAVLFVAGHENSEKGGSTVDWGALARSGATLCIYMGVRRFGVIAQDLIAGGLAPETPVAVVTRASLPEQTEIFGTLEQGDRLTDLSVGQAALIVVGEVVRLAPAFGATVRQAAAHKRQILTS